VSQEVYVDTGARQLPWTSSSLSRVLYFGRDADAPTGDDAQIIDDRRKLLLDIATVPPQSKAYVEAVAAQEDLKLADLYSMLEVINSGKGDVTGGGQQSLLDVAKRVREVLDDPILSGAPTDPELARLDGLANKAIAAGAFRLAFGYRQQEAKRAAAIENGLDTQQAQIDSTRRELAGVYARVAEAAMYNLNTGAEADAYRRAAKQSDAFDKSVSLRLRLRAANALADKAGPAMDLHAALVAIALYQDILKQIDKTATPALWAAVQLRMGETMWEAANRQGDQSLQASAVDAAAAALKVFTQASDFRRWSEAERLLAESMRNTGQTAEAMVLLTKLLAVTGKDSSPLDWARDEEDLGNLYFDLGFSGSDTDTDLLTKAAVAFAAAATGYQHYDSGGYAYMLARQADARARVALRTGDRALLLSAIADGRHALTMEPSTGSEQWGNQAKMLGEDIAAAGPLLDDAALAKEGLATLAKAERILTTKTARVDWAQMRESDGDALSYLGKKGSKNTALLLQAVVAYGEASEAFDEAGGWSDARARTRVKKIRLQQLLGQKLSPGDIALANIPPPAPLMVSDATASVATMYASAQGEGFRVEIDHATLDGKPLQLSLRVITDYNSAGKIPSNLSLLRLAADISGLGDPESQNANYGKCGDLAAQPGEVRLHYGKESALNSCILALMAPADAALWEAVWQDLPALIAKAAQGGDSNAARIDPLFAVKTVTSF
ncbi:MAG TPA: hypothetical protein VH722_04265, partial [Alphaproteobacteria bacterium]|nr:hypothetical protein [Alphaproteobacteria bacterium]